MNRIEKLFKFSETKVDYSKQFENEEFLIKYEKALNLIKYGLNHNAIFDTAEIFYWNTDPVNVTVYKYLNLQQIEELEIHIQNNIQDDNINQYIFILEYYLTLMDARSSKYIQKVIQTLQKNKIYTAHQFIEFVQNVEATRKKGGK